MLNDKDIELIDKYLSGKLSPQEERILEEKKSKDSEFAEELGQREDLKKVSQEIARATFYKTMSDIRTSRSSGKSKKIFMYSAISLAVAASVLLFLFILNPDGDQKKMDQFIAEADPSFQISILNINVDPVKSEDSIHHVRHAELEIAYIQKEQQFSHFNSYFFIGETLYLFKEAGDKIKFFYEVDREGKRIYYMCRNDLSYKFRRKPPGELYDLQPSEMAICNQD